LINKAIVNSFLFENLIIFVESRWSLFSSFIPALNTDLLDGSDEQFWWNDRYKGLLE